MATDKKIEKEISVEERLKALYQLQTLFSKIDSIQFLRGELPNEVKDLEDEIIRFQTRIQKHEDESAALRQQIDAEKAKIADCQQKIMRYDEQIKEVRNNREYSFLEKEKEYENLEIELAEKHIREAEAKIQQKAEDIRRATDELNDNSHILEEKKNELEEIVSETKQEEEIIRGQIKELETVIDPRTLTAFKRIRKNARNGLGIVVVERNACGGCFNRIPPQRQLDIKTHKKVIVCEYCGRIMIDAALAGIQEQEPVAETPKKKSSRRTLARD